MVYREAFFQHSENHHPDSDKDGAGAMPGLDATNLGLIVSAKCLAAVRRVSIDVHHLANPFPGLDAAIQMMRMATMAPANPWDNVRELSISIHMVQSNNSPSSRRRNGIRAGDHMHEIEQASSALASMMPAVCRVRFGGKYQNQAARLLYSRLARAYAAQLQAIDSRHPVSVPAGCVFAQLADVSIDYNYVRGYQLPPISAGGVVRLKLAGWPASHSWAPFAAADAGGEKREIVFPALRVLDVEYDYVSKATLNSSEAAARHPDGHPWRLSFPGLEVLNVKTREQDACPLLECAVLPRRMERVSIEAPAAVLERVSRADIPAVRRSLEVGLCFWGGGRAAGLAPANRILERACAAGCPRLGLCSWDSLLPVAPESVTCTALTSLYVAAPTHADAVFGLVQRLPRLAALVIGSVLLDSIQTDISVPGPGEPRLVEPTPTLTSFVSANAPREPIVELAAAYSKC
ncbi:hypothetical protein H4R18_001181 [Coemansia javaensis]|uniref:Uncharacterized protein n=1 Tax=Coemansia javaensis TaxID=2761396 RepID=A0A9W8HG83_9FUNG|nr:hypothetical protein H4R18_001181 [Coemansia javaensis]